MNVHFDNAGIRSDLNGPQLRVIRRWITLEQNRKFQLNRRCFDSVDQLDVLLSCTDGRKKDPKLSAAWLDRKRSAYDSAGRAGLVIRNGVQPPLMPRGDW